MKKNHTLRVALSLVVASVILYIINYLIFRDFHHIMMFFSEDLAFIPIEVFVTVLIIDKQLERREKKKKEQKINLLTEIFFEETGNDLLRVIASKDNRNAEIQKLTCKNNITDLLEIESKIKKHECEFSLNEEDLEDIFKTLSDSKDSLVRFIENPYLDEHDIFTDLLQSAFHAYSDIKHRKIKGYYTKADLSHISEDISRLYKYLAKEWIVYFRYIEKEYPYLYKLVLDDIPFDIVQSSGTLDDE